MQIKYINVYYKSFLLPLYCLSAAYFTRHLHSFAFVYVCILNEKALFINSLNKCARKMNLRQKKTRKKLYHQLKTISEKMLWLKLNAFIQTHLLESKLVSQEFVYFVFFFGLSLSLYLSVWQSMYFNLMAKFFTAHTHIHKMVTQNMIFCGFCFMVWFSLKSFVSKYLSAWQVQHPNFYIEIFFDKSIFLL